MLGDEPGVTAENVAALLAGRGEAPIAVCAYTDGRGHPLAFSRALFPELSAMHGDKAVWKLLDRHGDGAVDVPVSGEIPPRRGHVGGLPGAASPQIARAIPVWGSEDPGFPLILVTHPMAKDTEKLIRQLSLISFLMAERRPVSALEIKQDVEGYSQMNDEAFARRFYADRAELESLGIHLKVDKPAEGYYEAENYSLPPENFYLPGDRVHRQGAGRAADVAVAARRRVRLRRAAAARASAALLGQALAARRARAAQRRAGGHGRRGRARALAAAVEGRDGDLPPQDDRLRLLHDRPRRPGEAQGGPVPPALPRRAVLPDRLLARARRRARVPGVADPRQGRLLLEGGARLQPARGLRPARVRHAHRLAARRSRGARAHLALGPHRLARPAPLRPRRRRRRTRTAA